MTDAADNATRTQQAHAISAHAGALADLIDQQRALPDPLVAQIRQHGFFHLLVPRRFGGAEIALPTYLPLVETIARGDASTAWCVNQAAVYATMACRADPATAEEVWGDPQTSVANGPPSPTATLASAPDGYRLAGRWEFSSGCRHANWVAAAARMDHAFVVCMLPVADVQLLDEWQVQGLRGTGSFAFAAADAHVPRHRTFPLTGPSLVPGPLYQVPINLLFAAGFAAVALGNARAALDAGATLLSRKRPVFETSLARERTTVQADIARAEAIWGAARAYLSQQVDALWQSTLADGAPSMDTRIGLRLAATHAIHCAADAVQLAYKLSGSSAIFSRDPLQRRFQDAHVITQQVQGRTAHYETVGQHLLGLNPKAHFH